MKASDFGDKLSDLGDALENCRADIEEALNCWEGEEMDDDQKATIRFYRAGIAALQGQLDKDGEANMEATRKRTP